VKQHHRLGRGKEGKEAERIGGAKVNVEEGMGSRLGGNGNGSTEK